MLSQEEFVETKLATRTAELMIRVYADDAGKESLVLYTEHLDTTQPVLVRVHSECLTGDTFGSLQCDCGEQLNKSLHLIGEEGGVVIYLRQEGRGIGLFEKIKTYQLQSRGHDTFEANVLLGHHPDARSYEMVKTILDDLHISRIKLLTNNPSKVSDIAKLGIEVVTQVPLLSKPNPHNEKYLETKRKKFKHFLENAAHHYFYQFQVDNPEQVKLIAEFLKDKKRDPLLKICVGIAADHSSLHNPLEIERIETIIQTAANFQDFIPVIHFSFRNSPAILEDIAEIKRIWKSAERIQLNDLPKIELSTLRNIFDLFVVDLPLSDDNFDIIHNREFRELIENHKSFLLLDNSRGRGIKESKDSLLKKIDILLAYGLNDIALCGGFGPDELDRYFEIRRYYRINFSIDAESKLKTDGKIDLEKVKLYLLQLMRFDDPKQIGIEQTRKFLEEHRRSDWDKVIIHNTEFSIHPKVFHPGHFPSTSWFASELRSLLKDTTQFCEVGCGSGAISCLLALAHPHLQITATDINPYATENTRLNAKRLHLNKQIHAVTGDVLDSLEPDASFDSIFWLLPFGFLDPGTHIDLEETQVFDPGYRATRKFFQTAKKHLRPKGQLWIGFSSSLGHMDLLEDLAKECSIDLVKVTEKVLEEATSLRFELLKGTIRS